MRSDARVAGARDKAAEVPESKPRHLLSKSANIDVPNASYLQMTSQSKHVALEFGRPY